MLGTDFFHVRDGAVVREFEVTETDDVLGADSERQSQSEEEGAHGGALYTLRRYPT